MIRGASVASVGQVAPNIKHFHRNHTVRHTFASNLPRAACAALFAAFGAPGESLAQEPDRAARLIKELGVIEDTASPRDRKDWRAPKKIVILASGGSPSAAEQKALAEAAPTAKLLVVDNVAAMAKAATDADIVLGLTSYPGICEPEVIDNARQLRWILSMSAGVERCIAVDSVHERKLLLTNQRATDAAAISEHAIALALAMGRGLDTFVLNQQQSRWSPGDAGTTQMQTLSGKTMLVVGLGGIGTEVASRAHALGMKVIATRASGRTGPDYVSYVGLPDELLKLAATADVIVNSAPLTKETTGIFDAKFFATLKPTAYFINVARGGSVVTADLLKALTEKRLAGAGLDVVDPEPLPADHPLWKAPNVIITPHISTRTDVPRTERWILATENLRRYVAGEKMLSVVNLEREY